MKQSQLAIPEIGLIAVTRGMLGAGLALLVADSLTSDKRKSIGWPLFLIGAITTIPLMADVLRKSHQPCDVPLKPVKKS